MVNGKNDGKIIVIVAPSGTGKSTLIDKIKREFPILEESISHTTRDRRENEEHGKHYFFVDKDEFERLRDGGHFLEWALVHDDYKGTSRDFVQKKIDEGSSLLFDLDVQGSDAMKNFFGDRARVIFIEPPSFEELEKRLRGRKTESEEKIQVRLENARKELARRDDYDFCVTNDEFDQAYEDLKNVIERILEE